MAVQSPILHQSELLSITPEGLAEVRRLLGNITYRGRSAAAVALQAAISDTVTTGRKIVRDGIQEHLNLRDADVNKVIKVRRGSYNDPSGTITITRRSVPLIRYLKAGQQKALAGRVIKRGTKDRFGLGRIVIRARKIAQGGYSTQETLPARGFVQIMPRSGKVGIFLRKDKRRLPIRLAPGPTPLGVLGNARGAGGQRVVDQAAAAMGQALEKNIRSQVDGFLRGGRKE